MLENNINFSVKLKNTKNENQVCWLSLPCTKSYFQKEIATNFDDEYKISIDELVCNCIDLKEYYHEYNLNKLNYLSSLLQDLSSSDIRKLSIVQEEGSYTKSIDELINTVLNIDYFEFIESINSFEDLSKYYGITLDNDYLQIKKELIDDENGVFINGGYLLCANEWLPLKYNKSDIPELYCLVDNSNSEAI